jgi:SlyX protein
VTRPTDPTTDQKSDPTTDQKSDPKSDPTTDRIDLTAIEERLAHLQRSVDDLSDVIARQEREIARLAARVALLMEREAERAAATDAPAGQQPPHW